MGRWVEGEEAGGARIYTYIRHYKKLHIDIHISMGACVRVGCVGRGSGMVVLWVYGGVRGRAGVWGGRDGGGRAEAAAKAWGACWVQRGTYTHTHTHTDAAENTATHAKTAHPPTFLTPPRPFLHTPTLPTPSAPPALPTPLSYLSHVPSRIGGVFRSFIVGVEKPWSQSQFGRSSSGVLELYGCRG